MLQGGRVVRTKIRTIAIINAVAALAFAGRVPAPAQQAQPAAGQVNVQAHVDEVLLDMVVNDKESKPVLDLQPADVAVTDNGHPVTLTQLRLISGKQQDGPLITLLFNKPGFQKGQSDQSAVQAGKSMREAASRMLKLLSGSGLQFSVMDVWGRLQLQQEFTSDRKAVEKTVTAAVTPGQFGVAVGLNAAETRVGSLIQTGKDASGAPASSMESLLDGSISDAIVESSTIYNQLHASAGLAGLLSLAESQRQVPGRKAVIYFTTTNDLLNTDPNQPAKEYSPEVKAAIQSIVEAANRADLSIYIVHMDGQNSQSMGEVLNNYAVASLGSSNSGPPGGKSGTTSTHDQQVTGRFASASEFQLINSKQSETNPVPGTVDSLVRGTGGYAFSESEDFQSPVKQLITDLTTYYEASYVPPEGKEDGTFHTISVVPVRPGLTVRTRSGYLAVPGK